jgi:hypothetical protein
MSYLTIYAHHNFKSIEFNNISTKKLDNMSITKLDILKKLKILLFG